MSRFEFTRRVRSKCDRSGPRCFFARFARASSKGALARKDFQLLHYSFQDHHVHLIVEAENQVALGNGMKAINSRIAHAVQRVFEISGKVISGPYHAHLLRTPNEVFRAISYVLLNIRKHWCQSHRDPPPVQIDAASSARWFDGFTRSLNADRSGEPEVGRPRSWLLSQGWKQYGMIDPAVVPGTA